MSKVLSYLATLVQETHRTEADVVALVVETGGLRQLRLVDRQHAALRAALARALEKWPRPSLIRGR